MIKTDMTRLALSIAMRAHEGQVDRAGNPYYLHPLWVADHAINGNAEEDVACAALLHDVLEDTDYSAAQLEAEGFNRNVMHALRLLTHIPPSGLAPEETEADYLDYVRRIRKDNGIARWVKLADLRHNSDLSRLPASERTTPQTLARLATYCKAFAILEEASLAK